MLIAIGMVLLSFAVIVYVWQHPEVLELLGISLQQGSQAIEEAKEDLRQPDKEHEESLPLVADEVPPTIEEQLLALTPGHFVELTLDGETREMQVNAASTHFELRQYDSANWERGGVRWQGLELYGDWLLTQVVDNWYLFTQVTKLSPDEVRAFQPYAEKFGAADQKRGSVEIDWDGKSWPIADIGMFDVEVAGNGHLDTGTPVRFLLAEGPEENVLYVEHVKRGPGFVWVGRRVDSLDDLVLKIT